MKTLICFMLAGLFMLSGALAENEITFQMDQVFVSDSEGTIHYNLYVPESSNGTVPYALYMALPGWGGLYFQGVGSNLREAFIHRRNHGYEKRLIISDDFIIHAVVFRLR